VALGLVAVLSGLLFKIGAVPAHFWVPDVTEGTSAPVAAYVTTLPKIGGLVAAFRLVHQALPAQTVDWPLLVAVLAAACMTLGNLAAFFQTSVKRLLAYSTISQVGYLLMAVAVATRSGLAQQALLFYLAAYALTNIAVFSVVTELPNARTLDDYRGLARRRPALAAVLVVCLLGFVGTPPTGVFLGKLEVFSATVDGGYTWLAALAVANTVASLFYYLRWLGPLFRPVPDDLPARTHLVLGRWSATAAYTAGGASLALGIAGGAAIPLTLGPLLR
jgi:NADH-quinone oxidoreductase subunit N